MRRPFRSSKPASELAQVKAELHDLTRRHRDAERRARSFPPGHLRSKAECDMSDLETRYARVHSRYEVLVRERQAQPPVTASEVSSGVQS